MLFSWVRALFCSRRLFLPRTMAVIMAMGGEEVMTAEQFAQWWEDTSDHRTGGLCFHDQLRQELANRLGLANFRQLRVLAGKDVLGPESAWEAGPFSVIVRPFLEADAGKRPLFEAAEQGKLSELVRLLEMPLDPAIVNKFKCSPLHIAASHGREELVCCLLDAGADKHKAEFRGMTPLHLAAATGYDKVARCLLEAGADANKTDAKGRTPLHVAAKSRRQQVARCLLEAGADMARLDNTGCTPLHLAVENGMRSLLTAWAEKHKADLLFA